MNLKGFSVNNLIPAPLAQSILISNYSKQQDNFLVVALGISIFGVHVSKKLTHTHIHYGKRRIQLYLIKEEESCFTSLTRAKPASIFNMTLQRFHLNFSSPHKSWSRSPGSLYRISQHKTLLKMSNCKVNCKVSEKISHKANISSGPPQLWRLSSHHKSCNNIF